LKLKLFMIEMPKNGETRTLMKVTPWRLVSRQNTSCVRECAARHMGQSVGLLCGGLDTCTMRLMFCFFDFASYHQLAGSSRIIHLCFLEFFNAQRKFSIPRQVCYFECSVELRTAQIIRSSCGLFLCRKYIVDGAEKKVEGAKRRFIYPTVHLASRTHGKFFHWIRDRVGNQIQAL
jgi:hypothetical protein